MISTPFTSNSGGYHLAPVNLDGSSIWSSVHLSNSFNWSNSWYTARQVISRRSEPEFSARSIFFDKYTGEYMAKERNGRTVKIGKIQVKKVLVVNPKSESEFEAVYCEIECDSKTYVLVLSYKDYCKRNLLPHIPFFKRNPDCPDSYIVAAVYLAIQDFPDAQFLHTPSGSGWQRYEEGKLDFASASSVFPGLEAFYPQDLHGRQLLKTDRALSDIIVEYRKALSVDNSCKLLTLLRIYAVLSGFINNQSLTSEVAFIVKPTDERCARMAIALLKTDNYCSTSVNPLLMSKIELKKRLDSVNDGVVILRDTSLVEDRKRRIASLEVLQQDINGADGMEKRKRHIIVIIEDNPGYIPPEFPTMFMALPNILGMLDVPNMQRLSGEFDSALIKKFVQDPNDTLKDLKESVDYINYCPDFMYAPERAKTIKSLIATAVFLRKLGLFSNDDLDAITAWMTLENGTSESTNVSIINDFRKVLNFCIMDGVFEVVAQGGPPFYRSGSNMIIEDRFFLNFETNLLDKVLLPMMRSTRRRNTLLAALNETGYLHANNNYKRLIEAEIAPGKKMAINVYSVDKGLLDEGTREKLREQEFAEFFTEPETYGEEFSPIIVNDAQTKIAGLLLYEWDDVNKHQYVSGATRSGKTFYLCQQVVLKAAAGEQVIIFDHSGAFSERELLKHLSPDIISKYFEFWDINKCGLPVNLMYLDDCTTLPEKKNRLLGILASAVRVLGDVQEKVLRRRISALLKERDKDPDVNLCQILDYLDPGDTIQRKLIEKFYDVFDGLEDLGSTTNSWDSFLKHRKKIVVVSTSEDNVHKSTYLVDMLLSSLFSYKQYHPEEALTVVLDEVEDQYLVADAPIDIILRKGGKSGLTLLLASQEFSVDRDRLGKLIGNCGTLVFFRPKSDNLKDIAKLTGFDTSTLAGLDQGECIAVGNFGSSFYGKNKHIALKGRTYTHEDIDDNDDSDDDIPDNYIGTMR